MGWSRTRGRRSSRSIRPMREAAVDGFLKQADCSWDVVEKLLDQGKLAKTEYQGNYFYLRRPKAK